MSKRLLCRFLPIILTLFCLLTSGCALSYRQNIRKLNKIEPVGDYTFQQQYVFTYKGETYSISDNKTSYRKKFKLKKGNGAVFPESAIYGDYIYALFYYGAYKENDTYFNDAILVRAHVKNPKNVEIIDYYKKCPSYYCYLHIEDGLIFVDGGYLFVYDVNNIKPIYSLNDSQEKMLYFDNDSNSVYSRGEYLVICTKDSSDTHIGDLIVIENRSIKYQLNDITVGYNFNIFNDYIISNTTNGEKKVYSLKTSELLDNESANIVLSEYEESLNNNENEDTDEVDKELKYFEFKGIKYSWKKIAFEVEINKSNNNHIKHYDVVITNLETQEQYTLTHSEFQNQAKKILDIVKDIECQTIYSQNDELYFCYYTYDEAWGMLYDGSPSIVFKYDEQTNKLVYIGYGSAVGHTPIVHKGNLLD